MNPKVSIVIVNWKTPELLADCLQSIRADVKSSGYEIWVVDNASGDGSVAMLEKDYPWVRLIANKVNVGFARACNQVIPFASAPYVLLLNPDTVVKPDAISLLADFLDANANCAAVGPQVLNPDGTLQLACRRSFPSPAAAFYRVTYLSKLFPKNPTFARYNLTNNDPTQQLDVDALSGSCMMVRKTVIDALGLLDEDIFMFGEDIDWCWRFKQNGWRVTYLPQSIVYHYHGASSRLRPVGATLNLHKGMEVFYRKHMAPKYWAPFNWAVYTAIWMRCIIFMGLAFLRSRFVPKHVLSVLAGASESQAQSANSSTRTEQTVPGQKEVRPMSSAGHK
jgi:N-acetylglucosaminyl-diphospho-decaprenol L-rhamnosyltransferase